MDLRNFLNKHNIDNADLNIIEVGRTSLLSTFEFKGKYYLLNELEYGDIIIEQIPKYLYDSFIKFSDVWTPGRESDFMLGCIYDMDKNHSKRHDQHIFKTRDCFGFLWEQRKYNLKVINLFRYVDEYNF